MKEIRNILNIVSSLLAISLAACSSGNNSSNQSTLPVGPVDYVSVQSLFADSGRLQNQGAALNSGNNGGCGVVSSDVGAGMAAATGFVSFIPVVGPVLGAIFGGVGSVLTLAGGNNASSCMSYGLEGQINNLNQEFCILSDQLFLQQQQINNIESNMDLSNNQIWSQMNTNAAEQQNSAFAEFNQQVKKIYGADGVFAHMMQSAGLYSIYDGTPTGLTLGQLESSSSNLTNLNTYLNFLSNDNSWSYIGNIAGVKFSKAPSKNNPPAYSLIQTSSASYYMELLMATNGVLLPTIQKTIANGNNAIPILDNYNNTLVIYYQQAIYALQEIYFMAYMVNYLNYFNSQNVVLTDVLDIYGTYYAGPSSATATAADTQAYNSAQKNLTLLFSAVINQLYQNTLNYVVTDNLVGSQSYPNIRLPIIDESGNIAFSGESVNYGNFIGTRVTTAESILINGLIDSTASASTQYQTLGEQLTNINNLMIYQYGGVSNMAVCAAGLESYNRTTGNFNLESALAECPSVTSGRGPVWNDQSVFSINTLVPYYAKSNAVLPQLTGAVTNNINLNVCNSSPVGNIPAWNIYLYTPNANYPSLGTAGTPYLMCGNWSTQDLYNPSEDALLADDGIYYSNLLLGTSIPLGYPCNNNNDLSTCNSAVQGAWTYGENYTVNDISSNTQNNLFYVMNTNNSTAWQYASYGNATTYIGSGWLADNIPNGWGSYGNSRSYVAAIQYTFSDGFVGSFGIGINNIYGWYANTVSLSINPNLLLVTIDGQSLINVDDILMDNSSYFSGTPLPYSSISNLGWYPVISQDPNMYGYSALVLNNHRIVLTGSTTTGWSNSNTMVTIDNYLNNGTVTATTSAGASCLMSQTGHPSGICTNEGFCCTQAQFGTTSITYNP